MDIGVDLGTSNVLVYVKGRGVVINQPSVVAYEKNSKRIIAIGNKAKKMIGKTGVNRGRKTACKGSCFRLYRYRANVKSIYS